jgi:ribonucleases P/MRP protein subunit RPP40
MHMGRSNPNSDYVIGSSVLSGTREEKDLGVLISDTLKPSAQRARAARTAQAVLGQIICAFQYRDKRAFIQLYKQHVRPHLEFAIQAWSHCLQSDNDVKVVSGLQNRDFEGHLRELKIPTLEEQRHQADMTHMYKICTGKDSLNRAD